MRRLRYARWPLCIGAGILGATRIPRYVDKSERDIQNERDIKHRLEEEAETRRRERKGERDGEIAEVKKMDKKKERVRAIRTKIDGKRNDGDEQYVGEEYYSKGWMWRRHSESRGMRVAT